MLFDPADYIEVSYETFRNEHRNTEERHKGLGPITRSEDDHDKKTYQEIIDISNEANGESFHTDLFCNIFESDHITEEMVQMLFQCTLRNMSEDHLIKLVLLVISRFQKFDPEGRIDLSHWTSCLNDARALLVVLSNKYIVHEYMRVYREPVWSYVKCYLKYFLGLIKLDASAPYALVKHEREIVHLFHILAGLFQAKPMEEDLRLEVKHYVVQLFLTSTTAQINESLMHVICTAISQYDWMTIYLEEIFNYDRHDATLRLRYNFQIQNKECNVRNTTMLLARLVDGEIDKGVQKDFEKALNDIYPKCDNILRVCLNSNEDVLTSLMEDFNKMSSDPTQIPGAGMVVLYYFMLLRMTEKINNDKVDPAKHRNVVDVCFGIMARVCENFKLTESKCKHLNISRNVIYELLDKIDKAKDQFTLMSVMFALTILSQENTLTDEDKAIIRHSMLTFTDAKSVSKKKTRNGKQMNNDNETLKVSQLKLDQTECVLKKGQEHNIALCFNYVINERLKQTVITNCLRTVLVKIKKTLSSPQVLKYLQNLRKFYVSSYSLIDEIMVDRTELIMYETIDKNAEHKTVQSAALSLLCDICCKQENHYQKNKLKLCKLLDETDNVVALETLCNFFLKRFERESEPHAQEASDKSLSEPQRKRFDTQYTVIHSLLRRMKFSNLKSVILSFFSKIWFCEETLLSKLETKIHQMIKLIKMNWRDDLEQLFRTVFDPASVVVKKSMLCAAKQLVNSVIQLKKDDAFAWEIVMFLSNVNTAVVTSYTSEILQMVEEAVAESDERRLGLLVKIISNIILNDGKSVDQKEFKSLACYLDGPASSHSSIEVQLLCIELLRFLEINKETLQERFSRVYHTNKKGPEKIDALKYSAESKNELKEYACHILYLSGWLNSFPQIVECEELKNVHITLIQDILRIYLATDSEYNKVLALRALGKIHQAFRSTVNRDELFKLYVSILKDGTDNLKYNVVLNINTHTKQIMKKLNRMERDKEIKTNLKMIDNKLLEEATEIANLYLSPVLNAYYTIGDPIWRAEIAKFLMINLRFGTLVAHQVIGHLIAMLTDNNFRTVEYVYEVVKAAHQLDPTLLINNFKAGINKSYYLQKMIDSFQMQHHVNDDERINVQNSSESMEYRYKILDYKKDNKKIFPILKPLFDVVQKNCNIFLKMLVKYVEETIKQITSHDKLAYLVQNITTFQYTTISQLRTVLYNLIEIVTDIYHDCNSQYDQFKTEKQEYVTYLRMVQVKYLIQMATFFKEKYDFPEDLSYNPQYEISKSKLKVKEKFDQEKKLRELENVRNLLRLKDNQIDRIKSELSALSAEIAEDLSKIRERDDSSQDSDLIDKNTNNPEQVEQLENFDCKFDKKSPGGSKCESKVKNEKTKKGIQTNENNKDRTKSNKDNSPKSPLQEKIAVISKENKMKPCETNVDENSIDQNNNNDKRPKIMLTLKRPIHPHTTQKAKQANQEWGLVGVTQTVLENKKHPKKSSRKVHFDKFEQSNKDQTLDKPSNENKREETKEHIRERQILLKPKDQTKEVQEKINDGKNPLGSTIQKKANRKSDRKDRVDPKPDKPINENESKKIIDDKQMPVGPTKENKKGKIKEKTDEEDLVGLPTRKISKDTVRHNIENKTNKSVNRTIASDLKKLTTIQPSKSFENHSTDEADQNIEKKDNRKSDRKDRVDPKPDKPINENESKKIIDDKQMSLGPKKENQKGKIKKITDEEDLVGLPTRKISKDTVRHNIENKTNKSVNRTIASNLKKLTTIQPSNSFENHSTDEADQNIQQSKSFETNCIDQDDQNIQKSNSFANHSTDDDDDFMLPAKKRRKRLSDHLDAVDKCPKEKHTKKKKPN